MKAYYCSVFLFISVLVTACGSAAGAEEADAIGRLSEIALDLQSENDLDPLIAQAGEARLVLLGESTHGTREFYAWRASISRRLIEEKGFDFIAVEGDWATIFALNRYVKGLPGAGESAESVLDTFSRWPVWMWANPEILELARWLREHNSELPAEERVGIYGMDLYGEDIMIQKLISRVAEADPDLAEEIALELAGFAAHGEGYTAALARGARSARDELAAVVRLLEENEDAFEEYDPIEYMSVLQGAVTLMNAERHRRAGLSPGADSWNYRASHFWETCRTLIDFYGPNSRGIVWAHNTHIGDARATPMAHHGQVNIGQLARQEMGRLNVYAVGFGTHRGTVSAGSSWGSSRQTMTIPEAAAGSLEDMMNQAAGEASLFIFTGEAGLEQLHEPVPHRAVGVVFNPAFEERNYVPTMVTERYDAFIFLPETTALMPL